MRSRKETEKLLEGAEVVVKHHDTVAEIFGEVTTCWYCGDHAMQNGMCGSCGAVDHQPALDIFP